jgi:hypothetical protein
LNLTEYNAGGACFYEIDEFLRSHGFYWYDMADQTYNPAFKMLGVGQFDTLYARPSSTSFACQFGELQGTYCGMKRQNSYENKNNWGEGTTANELIKIMGTTDGSWYRGFAFGM